MDGKRKAALGVIVVAAIAGAVVVATSGLVRSDSSTPTVTEPLPTKQALSANSTTTTTTYPCDASHIYPGCTLTATDPTWIDTGIASHYIPLSKAELCQTTIGGKQWTNAGYGAGHWNKGLSLLQFSEHHAQPVEWQAYENAHTSLMATTISGLKYCAAPAKYATGQWANAFSTITSISSFLAANPKVTAPAAPAVSGTVTVTTTTP